MIEIGAGWAMEKFGKKRKSKKLGAVGKLCRRYGEQLATEGTKEVLMGQKEKGLIKFLLG